MYVYAGSMIIVLLHVYEYVCNPLMHKSKGTVILRRPLEPALTAAVFQFQLELN